MSGDSTDEFPIVGHDETTDETNHDDSHLDENVWSEEFDVGSTIEITEDAPAGSFFSRIRSLFSNDRTQRGSNPLGVEIDDFHVDPDQPVVNDAAARKPFAAKPGPRIIDVKAVDRRGPSSRDPDRPGPGQPALPLSGTGPAKPVSRPSRASLDRTRAADSAEPDQFRIPDEPPSDLEDFAFDRDDFQIASNSRDSRRSLWLETLRLPVDLLLSTLHRIGFLRDRKSEDEIEVASRKFGRKSITGLGRGSKAPLSGLDQPPSPPTFEQSDTGSNPPLDDEFAIGKATSRIRPEHHEDDAAHPVTHAGSEGPDDYQVAAGSQRIRTMIRPEAESGEHPAHDSDASQSGSLVSGVPAFPETSSTSAFTGSLGSLIEYTDREIQAAYPGHAVGAGIPIEQELPGARDRGTSLGHIVFRFLRWFLTIPARCLTAEGDLVDQRRLTLEPILAAIPAMVVMVSTFLALSDHNKRDRFESALSYLKIARNREGSGDRASALLAAARSAAENLTPENQFENALLRTKSNVAETATAGFRLMRLLASPAGGNQPDAHLFIANEMLRRMNQTPETFRRNFPYYLAELRAGFEASPNRFDILEKLVEGLTEIGEDQQLASLISPYLEYWPGGHFFLAQSAFARGDDVLQKTHAFAMVRHFQGSPAELESSETNRIRFVISLALAGEFGEATDTAKNLFASESRRELLDQLTERIALIRLISRISEFPEGSDRDIAALGAELLAGDLSPLFETAVKRQLLRKGPNRPALLDLCRKLHAARKDAFDAEDYVYWASILRQNQQNLEARQFLENAVRLDPNQDVAANNLANLLYKIEPYDLERALSLSQYVVKRNPKNPIYLETRGQILARLGKCQEAIDDLSQCLESFPEVAEIHESLADCYRKIGNETLAKAHKTRFDELKARTATPPAQPAS